MKIRTVVLSLTLLLLAAPSAFADDTSATVQGGGAAEEAPVIVQADQPSDAETTILEYLAALFGHSWAI